MKDAIAIGVALACLALDIWMMGFVRGSIAWVVFYGSGYWIGKFFPRRRPS